MRSVAAHEDRGHPLRAGCFLLRKALRRCAWGFPSKSASVSSGLKNEPNLYASSIGRTFAL